MLETLQPLPPDPILGLSTAFRADNNPDKVDLGVGVYKDAAGNTPVMQAVKQAEQTLLRDQTTKAYVGPTGFHQYNEAIATLLLGESLKQSLGACRITMQTPGGCGGLRLAAELIHTAHSDATVWVSDPTWANHVPLLEAAGLTIQRYPYYDYDRHSLRFEEMLAALNRVPQGDLVLLHGCCHNPSGADLDPAQWQAVAELALARGFTVFIDLAYQGLGDGLEQDVHGLRLLAKTLPELIVVSSCSKNFGLYRERTGAITLCCSNEQAAAAATTRLAAAARANYSMPPDHGASIVHTILDTPALRLAWESELATMRNRINGLRALLVKRLTQAGVKQDFSFIEKEKGMFSFLGVTPTQVQTLIQDYGIYLVNSSRINVAGINQQNIDYLTDSIAAVLRQSG